MGIFQTVFKFLSSQKKAIAYSLMGLLTVGSELLFSASAFKCPCGNKNYSYGLVYLFVPALVLLFVGFALNGSTWKLIMGCSVNPRKLFPKRKSCHFFYVFGQITLKAFVAPMMWLSVALLNGSFYECAMSGSKNLKYLEMLCHNKSNLCLEELPKVACGQTTLSSWETEEIILTLQAESQVIGWCVIVSAAFLSLLITCYGHCQSNTSHLQKRFWKIYTEKEKEQFEKYFVEYATKLSERNLKSFFENEKPEPFPMPSFQAWEDASALDSFNITRKFFSTLHKVVEDSMKENDSNETQDTVVNIAGGETV
ncbi:calcium homeostasis modulator protein 5-like [Emydura macquarii macquarii]|uniref:calcium homeostasis modulator protein 5-like n=1 Tax=Emydura macquarii macquarii TaxID=1129001 RepID=UPI003529E15A